MSGVTEDDLHLNMSSTVTASQNPDSRREESLSLPPLMKDLRIVLLGKSVSENSGVGNFLLGQAAFDSEAPPDVVERVGGRLKDRHVTVINSPQLLQTNISDDQFTQTVRECVSLSDPGPHVIVLLLKHDQCSAEDQECVEKVLDSFSERVYQHTMVLTTQEPTETNDILQKIIQKCFNRHFSLQRSSSPDDLLQVFEEIVQMNDGQHLDCAEDEASQYFSMKQQGMKKFSDDVKLNLVVGGSDGTLKSSISELILQQTDRRSDVELHGRQISLVELPALFNSRLSEEEVMRETLRCLSLCHPGVHVFLLIIPDTPLTNEDKAEMEAIKRIFSSKINKHMMILIMQSSEHQTAELNEETQSVIESFGGRHHFFGPKTQVSTLMKNIEKMLEESRGEFFTTETFLEAQMKKLLQFEEMKKKINSLETHLLSPGLTESEDDLRIVLLGKTGVGKSATGNTILGNDAFTAETSHKSVTKESQRESSEINGRHVTVIDTPGLFDTELTNEEIQREISHCISMILPGPHVFIIVLNLGQRFTQEEATSVKIIQETFGERSLKYTMVLFTRGDDLKDKTIEQFLGEPGSHLMNLIEACGNRFHVFNNNQTGDRTQVSDLLEKIDNMVEVNGGSFYSCKMFRQMEREKQELQMKILMDRVREKEEEMKELEEEKERMKMMMEEERQNHDKERKRREDEFKREIREQEKHQREIRDEMRRERETFKHEIEEMRQEKEKIKIEREKLQMKYDTEIDRLTNKIENERQNHEKERKKIEKEYIEREEQFKTQIKEKEEKEREIHEEMKREREEWEKQKLQEKTRREEEDEKRREKEQRVCDEFNQRLKQERERMKKEKEDLQSKHEAEENKMKMMMEELNREREELMKKHEKEKMKMMEEERKNHDKERKRREEEFREREERQKREMKDKEEQEREMRENTKREQEMLKNEMETIRQEKENVKKEKETLKTEYITEIERLMKRIEDERQNNDTERKRREEEFNEREEQYKTQKMKHKEEREEQMQKIKREQWEWEKRKLEEKIRKEEDEKRREREKQIADEQILRLKSEMEGIIREKERIEREGRGKLEDLEKRLKEEINMREDQLKTFEVAVKLLEEHHEDELMRRQVEWREEYEREKEEMKKICSDSIQKVTAYRKLETEYSKWSWSLHSAMMETENKLQNKVDNKVIHEIEETDLQRELKKTSEEVEKSMSEFFEKDKDKDIMIQWKTSFEIKIKELQENIVRETKWKLNEILQQRDLKKKIDAQRTYNENTLYEKSKELALKLKDKTNNETLKKEFDLFWEQSVKKIIKDTLAIKDIDIMRDVKEILSDIYEGYLPVNNLKVNRDIFFLASYSYYVQDKKNIVFKDSFRSTKEKLGYSLSKEEEAQISSLVRDVEQQTDRMIQSFNISKMGYNISYIQQLTECINKRVTEHQEGPVKYKFKKKFFIHLVLSICKKANKIITDQHRMFREANNPEIYLKKKKQENYIIFQKHLHGAGAASAAIFGEIICQKLKEPIEQSVYKKTARDLTDEMRSNCESLNGNRSNLEKHILKTVAEMEDFEKYMNYINNPRDHFKSFIRKEVSRYITDKFSVSVLPKMKKNIELLQQKIMKAAHESTKHVQVNRGDVGLWLKSFTQQLSGVLIFSEKDLSGVKHEGVDDFKLLEDVIRRELPAIMSDISSRFNTKTFPVNLDYKFRPDELLIDHFCQCCWVQCPFCKATCTNTIENHHEEHSVPFHRVIGINGTFYHSTQNLCADICTNLVASNQYFNTENGMFKYRKYRKAGGRFANWSITPDLSELPYWRWFVCRFQKDLEKYHSKTFDGSGKIPDEWRKYSKLDAIESVVDQCI